ncbi:hypothetical protein DMUE_2527 [Dictyocoela muelleri]|nr:hypothetical protein DMUE_2527 [Dictyocoela muelleri]
MWKHVKIRKRDVSRLYSYFYFCKICRIKTQFTQKTLIHDFKIPLFIFLRYVYAFSANLCFQVELLTGISSKTTYKLKKIIIETIKKRKAEIFSKIGGERVYVQVDVTAIYQGRIIENPSSMYDDMEGIQWLIGGVEVTENKSCFLELAIN